MFNTIEMIATMQNMLDIEDNVAAIYSLAMRAQAVITNNDYSQALKIKELIDVIYYGLQGDIDNPLQKKSIENEIYRRGYNHFAVPVTFFLLKALQGGEAQEKGETEPAVTEQPTE